MIRSFSNERIKGVISLRDRAKTRRETGAFIIEGSRMCKEAPSDAIRAVYVAASFREKADADTLQWLSGVQQITETVSDEVFARMSDTKTPQGILAVINMPDEKAQTERLLPAPEHAFFLLLERIQDPGNFGTMLRTAEAAGVTGVFYSADSADLYAPKTVRSTMGAVFRVPAVATDDLAERIRALEKAGVTIYAADLDGEPYTSVNFTGSCALVIGNEGNGISDAVRRLTRRITIPMAGQAESLNAGAAAAVLLFEAARQRRTGA